MYTAHIGRRILEIYNQKHRNGPPLTARSFFDEVFHPLVFDDKRYLMLANNSKFDQAAKQQKKRPLTPDVRQEALKNFHADVAELSLPEGHLYLGGSARGIEAATSSQVTDVEIPVSTEEIYLTWLGAAAGIGVKGGFSLLVDTDSVLKIVMEGWHRYRQFMNDTEGLKPYQMESWNAWWLIHRTSEEYDARDPLRQFPDDNPSAIGKNSKGQTELATAPWITVLFALTQLGSTEKQTAYVYSFGQTNTTIGFIQLDLPVFDELPALYSRLFEAGDMTARKQFKKLYETEFGFKVACQMGAIGLRAIEPKGLKSYMVRRKDPGKLVKPAKNETQEITFRIYQTWIIAMLNNEEMLKHAEELAKVLINFSGEAKRLKKENRTIIDGILKSTGKRNFVDGLTDMLNAREAASENSQIDTLVSEVVKMPSTNVPLFLSLLRFKYAFHTNN